MADLNRSLGACYYPEHWPDSVWADDARRMVELGLTWVRIGEFAWSRLEPTPGTLQWQWLDQAIDVLGDAGLRVVLGTPTATPPRWMLDRHPDMLAWDVEGRPRGFGSRRHYCFSHLGYREEARRITQLVAERYGRHPYIAAWQTDNEYGCHDTTLSYSPAATQAFRRWLSARYETIEALNAAWGNVFWSMEYDNFDQIELPNLTVTEPNPAHTLAFRRFSSDQVVTFNRLQAEIIRSNSTAPILHNHMGRITDFDHFATGADLDIASWDSYPLGFLEDRVPTTSEDQRHYARQGDPDFQAFHHDLYRAVGAAGGNGAPHQGRWWVMEQQPGPVNWAPHNPAPLPGMVRLWTWEAFAHGAEAVCYFRWRQAPMAQEQLHSGLLRPDSKTAPAYEEVAQVSGELEGASALSPQKAPVALVFDYASEWAWQVQPHGQELSYFGLVFSVYRSLRKLGLSVDILPPDPVAIEGYKVVLAPGLMSATQEVKAALEAVASSGAQVILGPRFAARTEDMRIPVPLPPQMEGLDVAVSHLESVRADTPVPLQQGGFFVGYREFLEGQAEVVERCEDGTPALMRSGNLAYLAGWPDDAAMARMLEAACKRAGLDTLSLPQGLRRRETAKETFWFNYGPEAVTLLDWTLPPAGVRRETKSAVS